MTKTEAIDWSQRLGRKVSLRFRLHDDPAHPFSEAIGVVMAVDDDNIQIMTKRAETVSIPITDIEASKLFPV